MAYMVENFKTKKALKEAFKAWVDAKADLGSMHDLLVTDLNKVALARRRLKAYQPGGIFPIKDGPDVIEGPHFPAPHTWYAQVEIKDGFVVKIHG